MSNEIEKINNNEIKIHLENSDLSSKMLKINNNIITINKKYKVYHLIKKIENINSNLSTFGIYLFYKDNILNNNEFLINIYNKYKSDDNILYLKIGCSPSYGNN